MPTWADDPNLTPEDLERIEAGDLESAGVIATAEVAATTGRRQRRRDRKEAKRQAKEASSDESTDEVDDGDQAVESAETENPEVDAAKPPKKRRRLMKAIAIFVLLALLVSGFVATAAWARRGFFVEFNNSGQVVLYQGRPGGFLWIDPTIEATGAATRDELTDASVELVEDRPTFSSLSDATLFIRRLEMVANDGASGSAADDNGSS